MKYLLLLLLVPANVACAVLEDDTLTAAINQAKSSRAPACHCELSEVSVQVSCP